MKCQEIQELILSDYLDGELDEEREKILFIHLEGCERCRRFLKDAQMLKNLKTLKAMKPSPAVEHKILEKIEGENIVISQKKYNFRKLLTAGLSIAMVAAIAVISSVYFNKGDKEVKKSTESLLEEPIETYYLLQTGEDLIYSTMYMEVY